MRQYYVGSIPITDELYHHGILGQKWGIRRFQNEDGTRTEAGKERYTVKSLKRIIASNEKKLNVYDNTPLNKNKAIRKMNDQMKKRITEENNKHKQAIEYYNNLNEKEKNRIDRMIRFRNIGNAQMKQINRNLTQKYIDVKLYNERKDVKKYIGGYIQAVAGLTMPIAMFMAAPYIAKIYTKMYY